MNRYKNVKDILHIKRIFDDGIFELKDGSFSKSYCFSDINYFFNHMEEKKRILDSYQKLLNSLSNDFRLKLTVIVRRLSDREKISNTIPRMNDGLDDLREEYEKELKLAGGRNLMKKKLVFTVTLKSRDVNSAREQLSHIYAQLKTGLVMMDSSIYEMSLTERLNEISLFLRNEGCEYLDFESMRKRGESISASVLPHTIGERKTLVEADNAYYSSLYIKNYASSLNDDFLYSLMDDHNEKYISIDITPVDTHQALLKAERKLLGVETGITSWQKRQNRNLNFTAAVPYELEEQRSSLKEFLDDITKRDQKLFMANMTVCVKARNEDELEMSVRELKGIFERNAVQSDILVYEQLKGLRDSIIIGTDELKLKRSFTTEALSALNPFSICNIIDKNGNYIGDNIVSGFPVIVDRASSINGNEMILGVSGSGKSFTAKNEIILNALKNEGDIIIIDPEGEYRDLVTLLNGRVITIGAYSKNHINPLAIDGEIDREAIAEKSELMLSVLYEVMGEELTAIEKSVLDRFLRILYTADRSEHNMYNLYRLLRDSSEEEARKLCLALELFTAGSLNSFSKGSNISMDLGLLSFDISRLGKELSRIAMVMILEFVFEKIKANRAIGRKTFVYIDELYLLFNSKYSSEFIYSIWKRIRKYGGFACGITQNVDDLLNNEAGRALISNSEYVILKNQAEEDVVKLNRVLNLSENIRKYILNIDETEGLIRNGKTVIPFRREFNRKSRFYSLMTTRINE